MWREYITTRHGKIREVLTVISHACCGRLVLIGEPSIKCDMYAVGPTSEWGLVFHPARFIGIAFGETSGRRPDSRIKTVS